LVPWSDQSGICSPRSAYRYRRAVGVLKYHLTLCNNLQHPGKIILKLKII
jgi:hypothetical protein